MPIYEYHCHYCKLTFEKFMSIGQYADVIKCEVCGNKMKKVVSLCDFKLKGGGWSKDNYSTHYGDIDKATAAKAKAQTKQIKRDRKK